MRGLIVTLCVGAILLVGSVGAVAQSDAWIPGLASFVLPGLGQVINDQLERGIIHFGVSVAIWTIGFYGGIYVPPLAYATPALALAWHIFSGLDAYRVAEDSGFRLGLVENGIGFEVSF